MRRRSMVIGGEGWAGGWGGSRSRQGRVTATTSQSERRQATGSKQPSTDTVYIVGKPTPAALGFLVGGAQCPPGSLLLSVCARASCARIKTRQGDRSWHFPRVSRSFPSPLRVFFLLDSVTHTHTRSHAPTHLFSPQPCLCACTSACVCARPVAILPWLETEPRPPHHTTHTQARVYHLVV